MKHSTTGYKQNMKHIGSTVISLFFVAVFFYVTTVSFSTVHAQTQNLQEDTTDSFIEKIKTFEILNGDLKTLKSDNKDTRHLVQTFCATVLDTSLQKNEFFSSASASQTAYFDATQSAFLYVLCSPGGFSEQFPQFTGDDSILVKQERSDYGIQCNPESNLDNCDFHRSVHKIMIELLNDMSNIKIASAYGLTQFTKKGEEAKKKDQLTNMANQFGQYYFSDSLVLCDPKSSIDNTCVYPKTLKQMKSFLRRADSLAKKNTTFDLVKLIEQQQAGKKESGIGCLKDLTSSQYDGYNNYTCGLIGSYLTEEKITQPASLHDFSNLVYNEIRRYKMFTTYYAHVLRNNLQLQPYTLTSNPTGFIQEADNDANNMILTSRYIEQTAQDMILQISHIQFKFPIHIGLMMYYERLWDLRQSMVRIYTPLHQLYYKLRNVQEAK